MLLPPPKEVMFSLRSVCLFVCLSVCPSDTDKVVNGFWRNLLEGYGMAQGPMSSILVTIPITVRIQESEVRNPHSLDYQKSYQRILMKFYGELECGLETNWLHFRDDPHHYPDPRESVSDHDPDPGRTATLSTHTEQMLVKGKWKSFSNSIMLAFGGSLCSLSTSSFTCFPVLYKSRLICCLHQCDYVFASVCLIKLTQNLWRRYMTRDKKAISWIFGMIWIISRVLRLI